MGYTKAFFIAYAVNTTHSEGGEPYRAIGDDERDAERRCEIMANAIERAHEAVFEEYTQHASSVCIFMAPEAYFRGPRGAYKLRVYDAITDRLRKMTAASKWENWIFSFGTIIAYANLVDVGGEYEAYNIAFVHRGGAKESGDSEESGESRIVMKEAQPSVDFNSSGVLPRGVLGSRNTKYLPALQEPSTPRIERQQNPGDPGGIFELGGLTFGLEVCADHIRGRLRKSAPSDGTEVQIQLIPSAGANITPEAVVAREGGYVFNCDGSIYGKYPGSGNFSFGGLARATRQKPCHSELARVKALQVRDQEGLEYAKPAKTILLELDDEQCFVAPGLLHVYGPCALPAARQ